MGYWKRPETLSWFEPRWSFVPRVRRDFALLLKPAFWMRIAALSVPLAVLLVWGIRRVPGAELGWVEAARLGLLSGAVLASMLVLLLGVHLLVPPLVRLSPKGVSRQTGQSVQWMRSADLRSVTVDLSDPAQPRLRVESSRKTVEIGIGGKVALDPLLEFLKRAYPGVPLHTQP